MLLSLSLLFVGAVLVANGLWLSGRISGREVAVINFAAAGVTGLVALLGVIRATDVDGVRDAALTFLFSVTYLWVGVNRLTDADGRGLGWFSLFVSISVLPEALQSLVLATTAMDFWMGLNWLAWSGLWFLSFLTLALGWSLQRLSSHATITVGVITAWLPALVLLYGPAA
ncbi:MAG: hypothetical protein RIT14_1205 [Pseudomonadota bacterium]|jgi:hypothetical protein